MVERRCGGEEMEEEERRERRWWWRGKEMRWWWRGGGVWNRLLYGADKMGVVTLTL